jgi:CheY-like chemotaxis protein
MKTILVIEDTREMLENITEILQLAQYAVVSASNGKQGVELARQTRPDLILCDIMMPELDGYGVLHILSKDPVTAGIPFIFLSAKAETADFRFGMGLGADDYLIKPFDNVTLLNAVSLRLNKERNGHQHVISGLDTLKQALTDGEGARQRISETYPTSHFKKKQVLFKEGTPATALYFIRRGQMKLFTTDVTGNAFITSLAGQGDFVGYLALLRDGTYIDSAEFLDDSEVCTIPKGDFLTLIHNSQEVANQFITLMAEDLADYQERLCKLAYQTVRKRVAEALILFYQKFYARPNSAAPDSPGNVSPGNVSPPMTLSRENWSQLVGASTETVIRTLSDFRNEGLIDVNGSQITLLEVRKIAALRH